MNRHNSLDASPSGEADFSSLATMFSFLRRIGGIAFTLAALVVLVAAITSAAYAGGSGPAGGHNCPPPGSPGCGDPVTVGTGSLFEEATDYTTGGQNRLTLTRYFNSVAPVNDFTTFGNWRSNYDSFIYIPSSGNGEDDVIMPDNKSFYLLPVQITSPSGQSCAGSWDSSRNFFTAPSNINVQLCYDSNAGVYVLVDWNDTVRIYGRIEPFVGIGQVARLTQIVYRNGYTQTLQYVNCGQANCPMASVTDSYGRTLTFNYITNPSCGYFSEWTASSVTTPDGSTISYTYGCANLSSVTYPTSTPSTVSYLYQDSTFPRALTDIIDANGNDLSSWTYDDSTPCGFVLTSQNAGGANLTTFSYSNLYNGCLPGTTTVTNALGQQFVYKFSQLQTLTNQGASVYYPINTEVDRLAGPETTAATQTFTYDNNGYPASATDWDGNVTTYQYDSIGDEGSLTMASGTPIARTITTTWVSTYPLHLPTQIVDGNRTVSFSYDANGNTLAKTITAPNLTSTWSYTYNGIGEALTATDPRGNVTTYAYDAQGNLTSVTNALGQTTRFTSYDANGRPLSIQDPNGAVTTLTYNFWGDVTSKTTGSRVTTYTYDADRNLIQLTRPDGSYLAMSYDPADRLTGIADALGNTIAYTLDAAGNAIQTQVFDQYGDLITTHSRVFDGLSRLYQDIGAAGQTSTLSYDSNSNLINFSNPLNVATQYSYDALNRVTQTTKNNSSTSFGYDANSRLNSVADPRGLTTDYTYDGLNDQTSIASPDTGTTSKTYDAAGNLTSLTDANGNTSTYTYDALNRLTTRSLSDGEIISYHYDQGPNGIGSLTSMIDPSGTTSWEYDRYGEVILKQQSIGTRLGGEACRLVACRKPLPTTMLTTRWTYTDNTGLLASITYPSGTQVSFTYDANGQASAINSSTISPILAKASGTKPFGAKLPGGKSFGGKLFGAKSRGANRLPSGSLPLLTSIAYQPFGPVASWWYDGLCQCFNYTRTYDQDGRVTSVVMGTGDTITLGYDAWSRINSLAETGLPDESLSYDNLDRLIGYAAGSLSETYTYDANGNRTSYATNSPSNLSLTYQYSLTSNQLTGVSGSWNETYAYDANGNVIGHNTPMADYIFAYDARDRQVSASVVGQTTKTYLIDGLGQRVGSGDASMGAPQALYSFDARGHLVGVYNSDGSPIEETVWLGDLPVVVLAGGGLYYVSPDQLGAPSEITDNFGDLVWSWDHDPFGNGTPAGTFTYNLRFPGQYFDQALGLHYNFLRDYDPAKGRYVESDPIGLAGGMNTYAYAGSNPASEFDPTGLCKCGESPIQLYIAYSPVAAKGYHIELLGYDPTTGNYIEAGGRGGIDKFLNGQPLTADLNTTQLAPNIGNFGQHYSDLYNWPVRQLSTPLCYSDVVARLSGAVSNINAWGTWYNPDPDLIPGTANSNTAAGYLLQSLGINPSAANSPQYWTPGLGAAGGF